MFKHGNYDAVASLSPDFLLSVGDYHYGNVLEHHFSENKDEPYDKHLVALNDMRWWYRSAQWERSRMLALVPTINTWDDHDYGGGQLFADREAEGKEHSRRAMLESFANPPRSTQPEDPGTYFQFTRGDSEFFVVDARWHRPRLCTAEGGGVACEPEDDPLGDTQTAWLLDGLTSSSATFKFVAAGTRWYGGGAKAWTPFLAHRDALLQAIDAAGVEGVVFLSGGPHVSELRTFEAAGRTWYEVISSPLSSGVGACTGAAVSCYDGTKHSVALEVDTLLPDPEIRLSIVHAYDEEAVWDAPPIKRSAL
jgi:phosphodiesterase/alkaline phosphatase D-like protein